MPPFVPRKRLRSASSAKDDGSARNEGNGHASPVATAGPRRTTLFEDLEAGTRKGSAEKTQTALRQMHQGSDESSSLSSLSDAEFEDVPAAKKQKQHHVSGQGGDGAEDEEDEDEDEDVEFEDVPNHELEADPVPSGDLELTLYQDNRAPLAGDVGKKGVSKREKLARKLAHCMHVQLLLWHNALRNSWLCDEEVQAIMISHLPPRIWDEVDRWRKSSGLAVHDEPPPKRTAKGQAGSQRRGKRPAGKSARDWGEAAGRLEKGVPDMSHGDPLFRLMKSLVPWWKQRFRITAPGLRKVGYMELRRLAKLVDSLKTEEHDPKRHGERIQNIEEFRTCAQDCTGSRDVGAQLFTALLRGLGMEARMVASLQPLGFSFTKAEEADVERLRKMEQPNGNGVACSDEAKAEKARTPAKKSRQAAVRPARRRTRKSDRNALRIELDDSDEFAEPGSGDSEEDSITGIADQSQRKPSGAKLFDGDLEYPHYWTEVLSPATYKYLVVDPVVKSVVGTNRELVESLEPRGGKADKVKQVMAYVIGFAQDGTAKDVTVRYLKKQVFPGRTKGTRLPVEKTPVYNKHGKVKRYDQVDWFKSVMSGYVRGGRDQPLTEIDELEESTDLKPAEPEKKEVKEGEETLQYYKTSQEFVLARHLKREEALLPSAAPVKLFRTKGKGGKVDEENVFLRKDVVAVKSAETWHKQGRAPVAGEEPLKSAPYRAATTNRRREIAEAEAVTGHKVMQPLYSWEQTDWIIPDPIKDGIIPKNEYGNIDMFAEHMCPDGAVHVPYRGAVKVAKRLEIDYAEAVTGFEFGHRMAVPVIHGVVIAVEHFERFMEELEKDEAERVRKEDEKRRKAALEMWRKLLTGMRIAHRLRTEYGHLDDEADVLPQSTGRDGDLEAMRQKDEDMAGGFLPEGYEEDDPEDVPLKQTRSFIPVTQEDDDEDDPFHVEDGALDAPGREAEVGQSVETEVEADSAPQRARKGTKKASTKPKRKVTARRRSKRRKVEPSSDEDEDDENEFVPSDNTD